MVKLKRGSTEVATEGNSNITFVRWKDYKIVTVISLTKGWEELTTYNKI